MMACSFAGACHAIVKIYNIDVLLRAPELSGYYSLFTALYYVGNPGPKFATMAVDAAVDEFKKHFEPAQNAKLDEVLGKLFPAWQGAINSVRTTGLNLWVTGVELEYSIIIPTARYRGFRDAGQLVVFDSLSKFVASRALSTMQPTLDKGERVGILINIGSDPTQQQWVAIGVYQKDGDTHVCTMDSIGDVFADKAVGIKSDLVLAIEKVFSPLVVSGTVGGSSASATGATVVGGAEAVGVVGLSNNGNMCFQSSLMQALHKCVPLRNLLRAGFEARRATGIALPASITEFFATQDALSGAAGAHNPRAFCDAIADSIVAREPVYVPGVLASGKMGQVATGTYRDRVVFPIGRQQDASEFLQTFWENLQQAGVVPLAVRKDGEGALLAYGGDDGFHGIAQQDRLVCDAPDCRLDRRSPTVPDYTFALALAIPPGDAAFTLNDLLAHHVAQETMAGENMVECPECEERTVHKKTIFFTINPAQRFMMLQIKRFEFGDLSTKRSNGIILPEDGVVTINDSAGVAHRFKVTAVVVHCGGADGGHYWTVASGGVYNDSTVTLGGDDMRTVLTTGLHDQPGYVDGTGYLYFLERV